MTDEDGGFHAVRLSLTAVDAGTGARADLLLDADPDTTVECVARTLYEMLRRDAPVPPSAPAPVLYVAGASVDPRMTLRDSPIRDACVVSFGDGTRSATAEPVGLLELRVVGGPGAGRVHRLDLGEHRVGTGPDCDVRLADPSVPGRALALRVDVDAGCTVAAYPGASARLAGVPVDTFLSWRPGDVVATGDVLLQMAVPTPPDAAVQPSADGTGLEYNRPPRLPHAPSPVRLRLPTAPTRPERRPVNLVVLLVPLLLAGVGVAVMHSYYLLIIGLLSPVTLLANQWTEVRRVRRGFARQHADYEQHRARVESQARQALADEAAARRDAFPDPAAVLVTALGPRRRLWERRRRDPDFLEIRLGTAELPSTVSVEDPALDEDRRELTRPVTDVPVTVALRRYGVLGIAGRESAVQAVGRWAVAASAALHSPTDLQIVVLSGPSGERDWSWARWLPHVRPVDGQDCVATIGTDPDSHARRVAELVAIVTARQRAAAARSGPLPDERAVLVLLDGAQRLRALPGVVTVLRDGPAVGVYAVCLDTEERFLPEECQAVVVADENGMRLRRAGEPGTGTIRPDEVDLAWCRGVARALGPLRDAGGTEEGGRLPDAVRLVDLLGLEPLHPQRIIEGWRARRAGTNAIVGAGLDGPFSLDLRRDGPHALVAGTTGAGKSEFLQSLVASLAVANRPDEMNFVLIDYKGGSAFKDCVALPHTVGMVTDLDAHLVERAIVSLSAELRRRERVLAGAGAKDIDGYLALRAREPGRPPLPRLVIVIDEFASMVRDLPDFVTGLVNLAQRGRSLGIHLVLATQRPAGVVTADIRANTNLRIGLRMTDASESSDVLDAPDAARIDKSTPGRGLARLGHGALVLFQAGYAGGARARHATATAPELPWVAPLGWSDLGRPVPARPRRAAVVDELTDLGALVRAIGDAARAVGVPVQPSPLLAPLPNAMDLADVDRLADPGQVPAPDGVVPVRYGLVDLPERQMRAPLSVDLSTFGHLHVIGSPRSGRSQVLRTLAGALASRHGVTDVHLYGIDCGNGALLALADLPHCGAVVVRSQAERVARLLDRLCAELLARQERLAVAGSADLTELRAVLPPDQRPAHLVLLLDRWEAFLAAFGDYQEGRLVEQVTALLQDGASAGIHAVLAGDCSLLSTRTAGTTEDKLVLRLHDRAAYGMLGIPAGRVPDDMPPGRALRAPDAAEVQVALLGPDATGPGQAAAVRAIAERTAVREAGVPLARRPFRVDVLPSRLSFEDAWKLVPEPQPGPLWGLVGVGGDELTAFGADLATVPAFAIAGPSRSGRSTTLAAIARSVLLGGGRVVVLAPRRSPLRELAGHPQVPAVFDHAEVAAELALVLSPPGPLVVLVDDAELVLRAEVGPVLGRIVDRSAGEGRAVAFAGDADALLGGLTGWHAEARRYRAGALLSPQGLIDGELIGVRLPRSAVGGAVMPGRALVHLGDGRLRTLQVPELSDGPVGGA